MVVLDDPGDGFSPRSAAWDPPSGRLLRTSGNQLFAAGPNEEFVTIASGQGFYDVLYIPRIGKTLVATSQGVSALVDGKLVRVTDPGKAKHVNRLFDVPELAVVAARTIEGDVILVHDDGRIETLANALPKGTLVSRATGLTDPARIIFDTSSLSDTSNSIVEVTLSKDGGVPAIRRLDTRSTPRSAEAGMPGPARRAARLTSKALGETVVVDRDGLQRVERLTPSGFEVIDGAPIVTRYEPRITEVASRRWLVIHADDGLHIYDGRSVSRLEGTGAYDAVFDLPHFKKVLLTGRHGVYELTEDRRLERIPVPPDFRSETTPRAAEWVEAGKILLWTESGVFALDQGAGIRRIAGDEAAGSGSLGWGLLGALPGRGEFLVSGRRGLYLVVDRRSAETPHCTPPRRMELAASDVCTVPRADAEDIFVGSSLGWFADPGARSLLILRRGGGLLALDSDGRMTSVPGSDRASPQRGVLMPTNRTLYLAGSGGLHALGMDGILRREVRGDYYGALRALPSIGAIAYGPRSYTRLLSMTGETISVGPPRWFGATTLSEVIDVPWWSTAVAIEAGIPKQLNARGELSSLVTDIATRESLIAGAHRLTLVPHQRKLIMSGSLARSGAPPVTLIVVSEAREATAIAGDFARILSVAKDPGSEDAILATLKGALRLSPRNDIVGVSGSPDSAITGIAPHGDDALLLGSAAGVFRLDPAGRADVIDGADEETIGAVDELLPMPWNGETFVRAHFVTFALGVDGRPRRVDALSEATRVANLTVFPELRRAYAIGAPTGQPRQVIELRRRAADGSCSAPL